MSRTKGALGVKNGGTNNRKDHAKHDGTGVGRPRLDPTTTIAEQRALQASRHYAMGTVLKGTVYSANVRRTLPMLYALCDSNGVRQTEYEEVCVTSRGRIVPIDYNDALMIEQRAMLQAGDEFEPVNAGRRITNALETTMLGLLDADMEEFGGFGEPMRLDRQYWMDTNI